MSAGKFWAKHTQNEDEIQTCFSIRESVFVKGQNVPPEEEWDHLDQAPQVCPHFIAYFEAANGIRTAIGAARLWLYKDDCSKAQRVAVLDAWRKKGVGRLLMATMETFSKQTGRNEVVLGAQTHAIPFYESIGYQAFGPVYLDAGIPHRDMFKKI